MNFVTSLVVTMRIIVVIAIIFDIPASFAAEPAPIQQPSCDIASPDGTFPGFICKGEEPNGRCFCCGETTTEDGPIRSKIFGWSWSAESITCACSRRRHQLGEKTGDDSLSSLHCTEDGNYDELQCDNGLCWCVVPSSGEPTERFYPESMMRHLPCYSKRPSDLRHNYRRQCESKALARLAILGKLEIHGTSNTHIDMPQCDYDGSYAAYSVDKNQIHCVWKDGKQISNFYASTADIKTTNCYCARDSVIYLQENMDFSMSCETNGNYENPQTSNGRPYCVDSDGFATSQMGSIGATIKCPQTS